MPRGNETNTTDDWVPARLVPVGKMRQGEQDFQGSHHTLSAAPRMLAALSRGTRCRLRSLGAVFAVALLVAGCGSGGSGQSTSGAGEVSDPPLRDGGLAGLDADPAKDDVEAGRGKQSCAKDFVEAGVRNFLAAANSGSRERLYSAIADRDAFPIFSQGLEYGSKRPSRFFKTKNRGEMVRHLLKRQMKGDRMWFSSLQQSANGFDRAFDICNIGFKISREIAGGPKRLFIGKGALDASTGRIAVWNTGGEVPG